MRTATVPIIMTTETLSLWVWPRTRSAARQRYRVLNASLRARGHRLELVNSDRRFSRVACFRILASLLYGRRGATRRRAGQPACQSDSSKLGHERELDDAFRSMTRVRPNAILVVAGAVPCEPSKPAKNRQFLVHEKIPSIYTYLRGR